MSSINQTNSAYILNIETATSVCSVSVFKDSDLINYKEIDDGYTHAENLHVFMRDIIEQSGINVAQLSAIAISKGPGSYTGLRIGTSAAKGLAYALKIPLIALETLKILTIAAAEIESDAEYYCPMIDARRMEVYTSVFDATLNTVEKTNALIVDSESVLNFKKYQNLCFFGDGAEKCKEAFSALPTAKFIANIKPSAKFMGEAALRKYQNKEFEDLAYFEPFYLKEFLAGKKKAVKE